MKRLVQFVTYAIFPVGALLGMVGVELLDPDLRLSVKVFIALLVALVVSLIWIGPILLYLFFSDSRRIETARTAMGANDFQTVYEQLHPMTKWTTCSQFDKGNQILGLLDQMYERTGQQTEISEVIRLHQHYFSLYNDTSDYQGTVSDVEIRDELKLTAEQCREMALQLPPPQDVT